MSFRRGKTAKSSRRRLVCLTVLLCLCASFFPLPVGTRSTSDKDQSEPYPCQHRPCGCNSAEQCWKSCCCFTNAQKLVWAKEHGVTPPSFVVEAAKNEQSVAEIFQSDCSAHGDCEHCQSKVPVRKADVSSCCSAKPSCCSEKKLVACCEHAKDRTHRHSNAEENNDEAVYVIGIEMQKCRGYGPYWNSFPWAVLPAVERPLFSDVPNAWDRPQSTGVSSQVREPPEPPPRLS